MKRAKQWKVMLSDAELSALRELAATQGLSCSDYLRQLIRKQKEKR